MPPLPLPPEVPPGPTGSGLWASSCAACGTWPSMPRGDALCGACEALWCPPTRRCPRCALSLPQPTAGCTACQPTDSPLSRCVAAVDYTEPWRAWILRFKHRGEPEWARLFARLAGEQPPVRAALMECTVWLPVPMAPRALGMRGYNQAWVFTQALHRTVPVATARIRGDWLVKWADTPSQHQLDTAHRLGNLKGAFALTAAGEAGVGGQHVALVDDVMTTGATLEAAARVLTRAGALSVTGVVFARTPLPDLQDDGAHAPRG